LTSISTFASHQILNWILGRQNFAVPPRLYLALSLTPLANDALGIQEPSPATGYSRIPLPNTKQTFSVAANRTVTIIREFIGSVATQNQGELTHFAIYDAPTGGNLYFYGELQMSIDVEIETTTLLSGNGINSFLLDICGCVGSTTEMGIAIAFANQILDRVLGGTPFTPPATYFLGVSSTPISPDLGVGFTEPTGGNYQRLAIPNDKNSFTMAADKMVTIAQEFRFSNSTTPWGNMTHFFISNTLTGPTVLWSGELIHSRNVELNTTLVVAPGSFTWHLDSCIPDAIPSTQLFGG